MEESTGVTTLYEYTLSYASTETLAPTQNGPESIARTARALIKQTHKEHFLVLYLDSQHRITGYNVAGIGTVNSCQAHPRDIFAPAILQNCISIIAVHNHPSGNCEPSKEDREITKKLKEAGNLLGIKLLDHVIVSTANKQANEAINYFSFSEHSSELV